MPSNLDPHCPVVVVCNISETFYTFLNRAPEDDERARLILGEQYRADRTLMWLGRSKLLFVSHPIPHAEDFCRQFGYLETQVAAPKEPSPWLCRDLLNEPDLRDLLVNYAGPEKTLQLIPYATTTDFFQLVDTLRKDHGLHVLTPESPVPERLWVRDYIDTKLGFHVLVSQWLKDSDSLLPRRIVCQDLEAAAAAIRWFGECGLDCLIKADDGENGVGNFLITPGLFSSPAEVKRFIEKRTFLGSHEVIVEEFIHSAEMLSPSLELFVPPMGAGEPEITYLSQQVFQGPGDFCGVMVDRSLLQTAWYPALAESGLVIARHLQEMGYVGHFDLDAIIDDENRPYLLEINSRRTGGTHVHEFGSNYFGPDYLDKLVLLSNDSLSSAGCHTYQELRDALADFLYPRREANCGVIITVTSSLVDGEFGAVFVAPSAKELLQLQNDVIAFLQQRETAV